MDQFQELRRRQVSEAVERLRPLVEVARPKAGWIRAIRSALGMTGAQLARRLGVTQPTIADWERRETEDAITLSTLRRVADGLGCDLVYAFVPRAGDLEAVRSAQAMKIAHREVARASHSMALEDQGLSERARGRQVQALTRELLRGPARRLWSEE